MECISEELRQKAQAIMDNKPELPELPFDPKYFNVHQYQSDMMNQRLKELWESHADEIGIPVNGELLATDEFLKYLRGSWGWSMENVDRVRNAGYVIAQYGGGGVAVTLPDGSWVGAMDFELALRMRKAWVNQKESK